MTTEDFGGLNPNIPQWKKDLILRRRAVGRVLSTENGSVQLTCPSVVDAVRLAKYSIKSDFHHSCESEREETGVYKNMRLFEQVNSIDDFVEPCVFSIREIITKIESGSGKNLKMGEEKNGRKKFNSSLIYNKKPNEFNGIEDNDNASDSSEEFKYGPGIVSRLKSKYLSLTLRESQGKVRPSLDNLRRAASLENILNSPEPEKFEEYKSNYLKNIVPNTDCSYNQRCRGLSRSNKETMKRARSVEVLTRCERGNIEGSRRSLETYLKSDENDIVDKRNFRERVNNLNVEEKELPPPDHVKHTLRIFEKTQNAKISTIVKNKNQKKFSESSCAKKSVDSRAISSVQNRNEKSNVEVLKNAIDINKPGISVSKKKCNESNINKSGFPTISEVSVCNKTKPDLLCSVSKQKAPYLKENPSECMTNKILCNEKQSKPVSCEVNSVGEKDGLLNINTNKGLSFDLTDLSLDKPSQKISSGKSLLNQHFYDKTTSDIAEAKRSISPVLVRAPPSILSSELNSSHSPAQQMKQVGVIRPIVTNKLVQLNLTTQHFNKAHLTEREIEKNLINKVKCIEPPITKVIVSLKKSPEECFVNEKSQVKETVKKSQFWDQKSNTMVFNFSNRKTVPDYIENDGMILAQRRDKSKVGESGFVFLNDETDESSADFDSEELDLEPPVTCDIIFEGDNILINGRSNIQTKPKVRKMKIQFNDEATTLFEYPSEASLLDDQENVKSEAEFSSVGSRTPELPIPFHCGSLASYTPSKLNLSTDFQLGITKTAPSPTGIKSKEEEEVRKEEKESEEDEYLRPAENPMTVTWNSETAADLLF